jgi:hypothetical protein
LLVYFGVTLFVSATLLFLVQPMIGKMILPQLGGTPAVWNTCMVFFQGVLLVGYGYTHVLTTTQPTRRQVLIQVVMLFFPFLVLPFALGNWEPPTDSNPIFALTWKLIIMVALPFFAVSTTAPLLQKWFAHTGHAAAKDPYFLYGASNLGSMLGLALYPTVIEPWLAVAPSEAHEDTFLGKYLHVTQVHVWSAGFAIFVGMVIGCAIVVWKALGKQAGPTPVTAAPAPAPPPPAPVKAPAPVTAIAASPRRRAARIEPAAPEQPGKKIALPGSNDDITLWRRLRWIGLAAVPSSLMLGVTTSLTTDIAAAPFFWIVPLMLYLLKFILVFARWPVVWSGTPHTVVLFLQPCCILFVVLVIIAQITPRQFNLLWLIPMTEFAISAFLHLTAFFTTVLMCHGELAKDRPGTKHLTEFYFWMSAGGVLGGLFNAFFAPVVFQYGIWEYPIAMVLACLMRTNLVEEIKTLIPGDSTPAHPTRAGYALDWSVPIAVGLLGVFMAYASEHYSERSFLIKRSYLLAPVVVFVLALSLRPVRFGLSVAALFIALGAYDRVRDPLLYEGRGFFGYLRVRESKGDWYPFPAMEEGEREHKEWKVYRTLIHGGINHGRQIVEFKTANGVQNKALTLRKRREPITYFHERNGIAEIFSRFSWPDARLPASMVGLMGGPFGTLDMLANTQSEPPYAVLGLGTGILASYAKPFQTVHFYEIDPLVRNLSLPPDDRDPIFFYVKDARDRGSFIDVKMGDGRLQIKKAPENYYHIILLDAFSSDAIPVHLLTANAVDLYMSKLAEGGVLIFNTTNKYVEIEPVLGAIAIDRGLDCLHCADYSRDEDPPDRFSADWVVLQRKIDMTYRNGGPPIRQRLEEKRIRKFWDGRTLFRKGGPHKNLPEVTGSMVGLIGSGMTPGPLTAVPLLCPGSSNERFEDRWQEVEAMNGPIWTDRYSNLLKIMHWR